MVYEGAHVQESRHKMRKTFHSGSHLLSSLVQQLATVVITHVTHVPFCSLQIFVSEIKHPRSLVPYTSSVCSLWPVLFKKNDKTWTVLFTPTLYQCLSSFSTTWCCWGLSGDGAYSDSSEIEILIRNHPRDCSEWPRALSGKFKQVWGVLSANNRHGNRMPCKSDEFRELWLVYELREINSAVQPVGEHWLSKRRFGEIVYSCLQIV